MSMILYEFQEIWTIFLMRRKAIIRLQAELTKNMENQAELLSIFELMGLSACILRTISLLKIGQDYFWEIDQFSEKFTENRGCKGNYVARPIIKKLITSKVLLQST